MNPIPHIQIAGALSLGELLQIDQCFAPAAQHGFNCAVGVVYGDSDHLNEAVLPDASIKAAAEQVKHSQIVLITYFSKHEEILDAVQRTGITSLQLHGPISKVEIEKARSAEPKLMLIKSLPVAIDIPIEEARKESLSELKDYEEHVDCFITDTKTTVNGELRFGATGVAHPWAISEAIVRASKKPVIIAGGLNPENIAEAIGACKPYGVDVHSGVEDKDSASVPALRLKSTSLIEAFNRAVITNL